jgi:beta-glucosidase
MDMDFFSVRWTGYLHPRESGEAKFAVRSDDGARLYINDQLIYDDWTTHGEKLVQVPYRLEAGQTYKVRMEYFEAKESALVGLGFAPQKRTSPAAAAALAAKSDIAIVFVGGSRYYESEAQDRDRFELPEGQDELIRTVAAANPNTIVVVTGGNPVPMPWLDRVQGVIYAWFPGQEGSAALTDALLGKANFSGKLPVSFPRRWEDAPAFGHYPFDPGQDNQVTYTEGLYVGYRHYDTKNVAPLFPFGFGLSYTTFGYSDLRVDQNGKAATVEFGVTNTGKVAGTEVAQVYVRPINPRIDRPFQELKGFERVELQPGETKKVRLQLDSRAFAYYDVGSHDWRVDAGQYEIRVGGSSRNISLEQGITLR